MKIRHSFFLLAATCLALTTARATTVIPPTFDELVNQAELIFQGAVTDVQSQWTGEGAQRHIVTFVTFKIDESIKGDAGATYTIRMLGGTVDGQTMEVSDTPKFKMGDRDILFVENNGRQFVPLVGIMHGRFRVEKDNATGAEMVVSDHGEALGALSKLGQKEDAAKDTSTTAAPAAKALAASEFKAAVRAKLLESR